MNKISIHENLPTGLFFFYLMHVNNKITLALTRKPLIAHADEDGYETTVLTNNFVGIMTVKSIIYYISQYRINNWIIPIFFHSKTELEFHMIEIDCQIKGDN